MIVAGWQVTFIIRKKNKTMGINYVTKHLVQ